jgi:hypothetical protein
MGLPMDKNDVTSTLVDKRIKGNLPPEIKQTIHRVLSQVMTKPTLFGASIGERVAITEASIVPKAEESSRTEVRIVCETTVEEGNAAPFLSWLRVKVHFLITLYKTDMLNPGGSLHGACAAFLIDMYLSRVLS